MARDQSLSNALRALKSMRARIASLPKEAMGEIRSELKSTARKIVDAQLAFGVGPQGKAFEPKKDGSRSNLGGHRDWVAVEDVGETGFRVVAKDKRVRLNMGKARRRTKDGWRAVAPGRPLIPYVNRLPKVWSVEFRKAVTRAKNAFARKLKAAQKVAAK